MAPWSIFLTHCCGLLTSFKLKALVTVIYHFTIQSELITRKWTISWGLWDSTGHSWEKKKKRKQTQGYSFVILWNAVLFFFPLFTSNTYKNCSVLEFLICCITIHIFKVLRISRVNEKQWEMGQHKNIMISIPEGKSDGRHTAYHLDTSYQVALGWRTQCNTLSFI